MWATPCQLATALAPGAVPGRESAAGVGVEHAAADHACPGDGEQAGDPPAAGAGAQCAPQPGCGRDQQQPGDDEVGGLDPAPGAVVEQAGGVAGQVEARPGQRLGDDHGDEQWAGDGAAHQQAAGAAGGRADRPLPVPGACPARPDSDRG